MRVSNRYAYYYFYFTGPTAAEKDRCAGRRATSIPSEDTETSTAAAVGVFSCLKEPHEC